MLTHEQAACLRCLFVSSWVKASDLGAGIPQELWPADNYGGQMFDKERAWQALAEYDAAHITIPRALLAELEDFVGKRAWENDYTEELLERTRAALKNP